jgi:hypothetical protein
MPVVSPYTLRRLLEPLKETGRNRNVALESRAIAVVDYDPEQETLTVQFNQRGTYTYNGISLDTYVDFATAESQGRYFNLYIRDKYPYEKVA